MAFNNNDYIDVATRIGMFRDKHPDGSLQPADLTKPYEIISVGEKTFIVVIACAYRDRNDTRPGVGMAWEPYPAMNQQMRGSELMLCETSAWGRAIVAVLAADTKRGVASQDELVARNVVTKEAPNATASAEKFVTKQTTTGGLSPKQFNFINKLLGENKIDDPLAHLSGVLDKNIDSIQELSGREASKVIEALLAFSSPSAPIKVQKVVSSQRPLYDDEEPF